MLYTPSFRKGAIALTTAAALAAGSMFPARAQTAVSNSPITTSKVSAGDCAAFGKYLVDEARLYKKDLSRTFLLSASRFVRANCASSDKDGEIQIITETQQDAASLRTALSLMGKVDIIALSGVTGCHRPPGGVCPTRTSADVPRVGSGS